MTSRARRYGNYGRGAVGARVGNSPVKNWVISKLQFTHPQRAVRDALATNRTVVMFGGNFSAKTFIGVETVIEACLGGFPWCKPPVNAMLVGLASAEAREAFQEYIELFVPPDQVIRATTREELTSVVRFKNGSKLVVRTAGQGRESFQGSRMHLIVFDEEPPWAIYKEARMRLRADAQLRILFTMTPLKGYTKVYKYLIQQKERLGVAVIQASIFENGSEPCQTCHCTRAHYEALGLEIGTPDAWEQCGRCRGYGVEPRVSADEVAEIEQLYTGAELRARLYGEWGELQGNKVFSAEDVAMLKSRVSEGATDSVGTTRWQPPISGRTYVVACDAGEGRGKDETVISVVDAWSGELVAQWANAYTPIELAATQVAELASEYNRARVWIEIPGPGYALLEAMKAMGWTLFYEQRRYDRAFKDVAEQKIGWHSSVKGRDMILRNMIMALRKGELIVHDAETVEQLSMLYHNLDKRRLDVPSDYHDDRIFSLAGAHEARLAYYSSPDTPAKSLTALQRWQRERVDELRARKSHPYWS